MHSKSSYGGLGHLSRGLPDGVKSKELSFGSKLATIQSSLGQKANTITSGFVKGLSHGSDRDEIDLRKDTRASDQRKAIMSLDYVSREYAPTSKNENAVDASGIKPEFYDEKEQSAVMANKYETENEEIELENEDSVNISIKKPSSKRKKRTKKSVLGKVKNKELSSQEGSQPEVSENQMGNDLIGKINE